MESPHFWLDPYNLKETGEPWLVFSSSDSSIILFSSEVSWFTTFSLSKWIRAWIFKMVSFLWTLQFQAVYRIGKGMPPPVPKTLSHDARNFILSCLQVNPDDRPTAAQLLGHPFVQRPPPSNLLGTASPGPCYFSRRWKSPQSLVAAHFFKSCLWTCSPPGLRSRNSGHHS